MVAGQFVISSKLIRVSLVSKNIKCASLPSSVVYLNSALIRFCAFETVFANCFLLGVFRPHFPLHLLFHKCTIFISFHSSAIISFLYEHTFLLSTLPFAFRLMYFVIQLHFARAHFIYEWKCLTANIESTTENDLGICNKCRVSL